MAAFKALLGGVHKFLKKPEGFFVCIALTFGCAFILIVPPFQTPDANVHFYRAYEVSEFKIPQNNGAGVAGNNLPASIRLTEERVHGTYGTPGTKDQIAFNPTEKYSLNRTKAALGIPLNPKTQIFYATSGSPAYAPLSYLPQALVVGVGRVLKFPVITLVYMVSVTNLLIWLVAAYIGIKIFPWKKWALVGLCLLPVTVSQSISLGLDASIFSATLLFLAIIFRAIADKGFMVKQNILTLFITGVIMVLGKSVLAAFLPLIFLIRSRQLSVKYAGLLKVLVVLLPITLYLIWGFMLRGVGSTATQTLSTLQLHTFLHSPWLFLLSLLNTIFFITPSGDILSQSFIGDFGWLDAPLSPPFVIAGYMFVSALFLINYEPPELQNDVTKERRLTLITISGLYILAVFLAMYIYFTGPNANHIGGVEGRYFVPLLFLLIPIFFTNVLRIKQGAYINMIRMSSVFLLLASLATILFRYYWVFIPRL